MDMVCFRGDTRSPDVIYLKGFSKRDQSREIEYRGARFKAGDIDSDTGVCVSKLPEAAAMFPLRMNKDYPQTFIGYLYAVFIDTNNCDGFLNTHAQQALSPWRSER